MAGRERGDADASGGASDAVDRSGTGTGAGAGRAGAVAGRVAGSIVGRWHRRPVQHRRLAALLGVCAVAAAAVVAAYPYPLAYPDPAFFRRVPVEVVATGDPLVTWDPPLRYLPYVLALLVAGGGGAPPASVAGPVTVAVTATLSFVVVPAAVYATFAAVRSRPAGLAAATVVVLARAARLPPSGLVAHHPQFATAYPPALAATLAGVLTLRAHRSGDRSAADGGVAAGTDDDRPPAGGTGLRGADRRTLGLAALTAALCGVTLNTEPWIAYFATLGIACGWAAHRAWAPLAVAAAVGAVAAAPLAAVPKWEAHLVLFVAEVVDPEFPLVTVETVAGAATDPATYLLLAVGAAPLLPGRGSLPGGWVVGFGVVAGLAHWLAFEVTTLEGVGVRGLYWALLVGLPAAAVRAGEASPPGSVAGETYRRLFVEGRSGDWAALLAAVAASLAASVWLFLLTYDPPAGYVS